VQGPSQGTHVLGDYAHKVLGYRKIAAVVPDYAFGWENMGGLQRTFEELGGKITQKFWFPMTTSDFSPYLTQISKDNDAVFACLGGKVAITLIRQYREYGLKDKIPLIGLGTFPDETILPQVGDDALGIISALQYSVALDTAANREFVKKYVERFGKRPTAPTENSYTIMQLIDHALTSLKGDVSDPEKVAKALRPGGVIEATRGPLRFDAYGGIDMNIYIRKVERVGGELQNTVIYTYPLVSQFWKYDPKEYLKQPVYTRDYSPRKP
jgi:branched-chain amino acid transport system substrate-binding protein